MPYVLFFLSGISGLVYQVIWVRQFGNLFGNTVQSAACVTSIFMLGLGVGSWWIGGIGDKLFAREKRAALMGYAASEMVIGALGMIIALVLPNTEALSSMITEYSVAPNGWSHPSFGSIAARYLLALVLLAPITTIMGGTLTLLARYVVANDLGQAGWRIGTLYGLNTAGAAVGALLTDLALVPSLGLFNTQSLAALINLVVGLLAFRLARSADATPGAAAAVEGSAASVGASWVALAVGLAGLAGMGLEIVWFRLLSTVLGAQRATFSLVVGVLLVGIWLGAEAGGYFERKYRRAGPLFLLAEACLAGSALLSLRALHSIARSTWVGSPALVIACSIFVPALFMGFSFPLANALLQKHAPSVGRRAGALYLANTIGAVLGAILTGFWLMPELGTQRTIFVLAILAGVLVPAALAAARSLEKGRALVAAAAIAVCLGLVSYAAQPADYLIEVSFPQYTGEKKKDFLSIKEGINESLAIAQAPNGVRLLLTNGHTMSTTGLPAQRYMRSFVHIPLLQIEAPKDVLVICFGVGNTSHAVTLHPTVERLEIVDLSTDVLERGHLFERTNGRVLEHPRVHVFVNDGRQHLRMQPEGSYDLVTLEPPPLQFAGVASLYSREFYALAESKLKKGGFVSQWLPVNQLSPILQLELVAAFVDVFPNAVLLAGAEHQMILLGRKDAPNVIDPDAFAEQLRARPLVAQDMDKIALGTMTELIGTFVASSSRLTAAVRDVEPMSDERPTLEYDHVERPVLIEALIDAAGVTEWCPSCFSGGRPRPELAHLPTYLSILRPLYLGFGDVTPGEEVDATVAESKYLQMLGLVER
jgi:spermidine synthase